MNTEPLIYNISQLFQVVGMFGLLASTFLFPFLALFVSTVRRGARNSSDGVKEAPLTLKILLPVAPLRLSPNRDELLRSTLESISNSMKSAAPHLSISIEVLYDDDGIGKWTTLRNEVFRTSSLEWLILVDIGTLWREDFLEKISKELQVENTVALYPSYFKNQDGFLGNLYWSFESFLKTIESFAGGPTSSHGATAIYKAQALQDVFYSLGDKTYKNDDVVLPLMLRVLFPKSSVRYLSNIIVYDGDRSEETVVRSNRLAFGNTEWVRDLMPLALKEAPLVGLIALRRVFRLFWGYWLLSLYLGGAILLPYPFFLLTIISLLAILLHSNVQRAFLTLYSSLRSPLWFLFPAKEGQWR